jgi:hypothetical protein
MLLFQDGKGERKDRGKYKLKGNGLSYRLQGFSNLYVMIDVRRIQADIWHRWKMKKLKGGFCDE